MIRHQYVGVYSTSAIAGGLGQAFEIKAAIRIPEETWGSIHAPLDDVQRDAGHF
jgi:hypothetical protein